MWNPLSNIGLPFLAQWNSLVLYPGSLIYLLLPISWSLSIYCLAHLFLAGMGMYWLAWRWTRNRLAASVAGLLVSYHANLPSGPAIVLAAGLLFVISLAATSSLRRLAPMIGWDA